VAPPRGIYYLAVDGSPPTSSGAFTLRYQASTCSSGTMLSTDGTYCGDTLSSDEMSDFYGTCGGTLSPEHYYFMGVCPERTVAATTCDAGTM
jgi:hypothetical protein